MNEKENINDNRKYQENLHWVFNFLFDVLHINCAQYNLEICVSVIYEGYMTVEMEYHNLTYLSKFLNKLVNRSYLFGTITYDV